MGITAGNFLGMVQKVCQFTNPSKENSVLLFLDGLATHAQNLHLIDDIRYNGVTIISFPQHTTHKIQPGDVAFMRPLSVFYDQPIIS